MHLQSYIIKHPSYTNRILSAASHFVVAFGGAARVKLALGGVVQYLHLAVLYLHLRVLCLRLRWLYLHLAQD